MSEIGKNFYGNSYWAEPKPHLLWGVRRLAAFIGFVTPPGAPVPFLGVIPYDDSLDSTWEGWYACWSESVSGKPLMEAEVNDESFCFWSLGDDFKFVFHYDFNTKHVLEGGVVPDGTNSRDEFKEAILVAKDFLTANHDRLSVSEEQHMNRMLSVFGFPGCPKNLN